MGPTMIISKDLLSQDALLGLIESFINREGTDYGADEIPLDRKVATLKAQVEEGRVVIVFDPVTETPSLMTKEQYRQWSLENGG